MGFGKKLGAASDDCLHDSFPSMICGVVLAPPGFLVMVNSIADDSEILAPVDRISLNSSYFFVLTPWVECG